MGFINHCNAALGKTVLSAGRNTSPLTAPAGRDAPGSRRGSGGRLLMIFAFYVCASATGLGPQGAVRTPPLSYFKPPPPGGNTRLPPAARAAERGRERGKAPRAGAGQGEASPWVRGFRPPRTEPAPETPLSSFSLNRRLRVGPTRRISHSAFRVSATIRSVTAGRTGGPLLSEGLGLPHPFNGPVFSVAQSSGEAFGLGGGGRVGEPLPSGSEQPRPALPGRCRGSSENSARS